MPWAYFLTINAPSGPIRARLWGELDDHERAELLGDAPPPAGIIERYYSPAEALDLKLFPIVLGTLAEPRLGNPPNYAGDLLTVRDALRQARTAEAATHQARPAPSVGRRRR